jgi:uncharacterized protein
MPIKIIQLGTPSRLLTGILQLPQAPAEYNPAVLLCRPIGQEAIRSSAMYRVLAERLAREGCTVARFDYHGTGDAPGEEGQQTLAQWIHDTLAAHQALIASGHRKITWFGMRLGANLSLEALRLSQQAPQQLVLWEPVVDGPTYLDQLLAGHREELSREFGYAWPRLLTLNKVVEPSLPGHVLGFDYNSTLVNEIRAINGLNLRPALRRGVHIHCAFRQDDEQHANTLPESSHLHISTVQTMTNWLSSQALGSAITPPDAVQTLLQAATV